MFSLMLKALGASEGWDTYILKAFSGRFGFDNVRTSQFKLFVKRQSNENVPWDAYIHVQPLLGYGHCYIYIIVGLSALLGLDEQGNAKAFTLWNRAQDWLHVFYVYGTNLNCKLSSWGLRRKTNILLWLQMKNNGVLQHQVY